ncbi:MAG TPA: hypothetical protein EYP30_08305 [Archaeoglobaceae archaeon]|nr:hypothetical protein [Archaeoglobaceae archaeon]
MNNFGTVFIVLFILILSGCIQNQESNNEVLDQNSSLNAQKTPKVFFYYIPKCPSCEKIKPYMNLMREEVEGVEFDFCDITRFSECSNESLEIMTSSELVGTPTVFLIYSNTTVVLIGWKNVAKLGYRLNELGIDTPDVVYRNESHDLQECITCHEQKNLPPPTTYTCTYCCHNNSNSIE